MQPSRSPTLPPPPHPAAADSQDVYVTILSVANCAGRQIFGFASDELSHRLTRPAWVAVCVFGIATAVA